MKKIFYKKYQINSKYKGERNYIFKTKIWFKSDQTFLLNNQKVFLKANKILEIKKHSKLIFDFEEDIEVWSKKHLFLEIKQFYLKNKFLLFSFIKTIIYLLFFFTDIFGFIFSDTINIFLFILVSGDWLFTIIFSLLIPILNNYKLKKYFLNNQKISLKIKYKNYKEVSNSYVLNATILWKFKLFSKIKWNFIRSNSTLINIKYIKDTNEFNYKYIQKFSKNCEPDEIFKIGRGTFNITNQIGWYETEDHTQTKGFFILSK